MYTFIPFFVIVSNISYNVGYHIDPFTYSYTKGEGYGWENFLNPFRFESTLLGKVYIPSDLSSLIWLICQCIAYLLLLWYFYNFIESNNGFKRSLLDIFRRKPEAEHEDEIEQSLLQGRKTTSFALF